MKNGSMNRPFGVIGINGLNFAKSVDDPTSNLNRVLDYIDAHPNATRAEICEKALYRPGAKSSWSSTFWSVLHKSGLVLRSGRGMTATYRCPAARRT